VTQTAIFQVSAPSPVGGESIWPSNPSASDPTYEPNLKDAFTTNFYHIGM